MITDVETDIAWLAGIIEGEGTFVWNGGKKKAPSMVIASTDLDIIEKFRDLVCPDRKIYVWDRCDYPNAKCMYKISLTRRAILKDLMIKIRPYMGNRRGKRIDEFLDWYEQNPPKRRWD
jgi:hypothetical protein